MFLFLTNGVKVATLSCRYGNLLSITRYFKNTSIEDVPEVSQALIKRVFKSHNIKYEEGYTCFTTVCQLCRLNTKSTLYINKTTGLYMCPKCKQSGEWNFYESLISKKTTKSKLCDEEEISKNLVKFQEGLQIIHNTTKHISDLSDISFQEVLMKLKLPKIEKQLLNPLNLRIDCDLNELYFPLENVDSEIVGYRILGNVVRTIPDTNYGGLVKGTKLKSKDTAVLVENLEDFLILYTSNLNATIICLPNGTKSLPQYFLPTLEKYKKIILWLGSEIQSWNAAKKFGRKLGEKRCLCVRPNSKHVLPHLNESQDFKLIISNAQSLWHKAITNFSSLRQDVLSDLQNIEKVQGVKWNRFPTLNKILKGHRLGELTVITGPTGSGKTTFISEYSLDLAMQGVNTLWGSFEIRNARLARTMLQQMVGIPLDQHLEHFDEWADNFEQLPIYYMTFHGQQTIKVVMDAVEHASYVHDINHVIIDNVQFMMGITEEHKHMDRFWKQDAIVAAFRAFATKKNCHVTLVIHPRKEKTDEELTTSSIFGGAKASQEADNVLLIQDKRLTGPRGKKYLQIAKNRYSGDLGVMPLDFDKDSLSYAPKKKKKIEAAPFEILPTEYTESSAFPPPSLDTTTPKISLH